MIDEYLVFGVMPPTSTAETNKEMPTTTAVKYDNGKVDWAILPFTSLEEIARVFEFGAAKYSRGNFAEGGGLEYSRVINSLLRHVLAFARGEDIDPESGFSHLAHAGCNVLMLLHYLHNKDKFDNDDRAAKILR